ncbi:hypothetical protein CJ030_MR1G025743 [Morella rubra]|uniref:Uncharacterized protein n=1 Tax=Morella rubra TaxID=262757 RepID=A0A6A1WJB2_9ROSI|nr:hypothetical protein CJ030_MR1G025743 [Morella rubra]
MGGGGAWWLIISRYALFTVKYRDMVHFQIAHTTPSAQGGGSCKIAEALSLSNKLWIKFKFQSPEWVWIKALTFNSQFTTAASTLGVGLKFAKLGSHEARVQPNIDSRPITTIGLYPESGCNVGCPATSKNSSREELENSSRWKSNTLLGPP